VSTVYVVTKVIVSAGLVTGGSSVNTSSSSVVLAVSSGGSLGFVQVTEAMQILADNTTANVSTTAHGYAPKLPNDATKFLNGIGGYTVPPSGTTSPLTTKGDVWGYSSTDARVPVGTNGQVLTAASGQTLGVQWTTLPTLDAVAAPVADVNFNSHKGINGLDPTSPQDWATKNYVDLATAALSAKQDCQAATTAALAAATYNNGSSGVGATLTLTVAAVLILDGYTPVLNDRLLVKNQASSLQNGLYYLSQVGVLGVTQAVLTRTLDFDQPGDGIDGASVYILNGAANANTLWNCTTSGTITFGTTAINWLKFLGSTYTADETTLHLAGTTFSIINTYAGQTSITTLGTVVTGTWQAGIITPVYGGTGLATLTAHAVLLGEGTSNVGFATIGTAGRMLLDQGAGADPAFTTMSGDGSITSAGKLKIQPLVTARNWMGF